MEDNAQMIELLIERTTSYGKTSLELVKHKAVDKASDVVSTLTSNFVIIVFISTFMLFLNLAIALWLGEILGGASYGFFIIAAFYGVAGIFIRVFMYKWLKNRVSNSFIKQVLK